MGKQEKSIRAKRKPPNKEEQLEFHRQGGRNEKYQVLIR